MSETETPVVEVAKPSKLAGARNVVINTGIFMIPGAVMIGASVIGYKTSLNNLTAAKIALEAAKLAVPQA